MQTKKIDEPYLITVSKEGYEVKEVYYSPKTSFVKIALKKKVPDTIKKEKTLNERLDFLEKKLEKLEIWDYLPSMTIRNSPCRFDNR